MLLILSKFCRTIIKHFNNRIPYSCSTGGVAYLKKLKLCLNKCMGQERHFMAMYHHT